MNQPENTCICAAHVRTNELQHMHTYGQTWTEFMHTEMNGEIGDR